MWRMNDNLIPVFDIPVDTPCIVECLLDPDNLPCTDFHNALFSCSSAGLQDTSFYPYSFECSNYSHNDRLCPRKEEQEEG